MKFTAFAALVTLLPLVSAQLNTKAKASGKKYFGTATDNSELSDSPYVAILGDNTEFGQLSPANSMKWDSTEPSKGSFSFSGGDAIVAQAQKNGQIVRGHTLVWYSQLPSWVSNSGFSASQLTSVIDNHITQLMTHFKGQIYAWDVVNEPFNEDGTHRSSVFYNTLGVDYIAQAFRTAHAVDPGAKLYLNEYNLEYAGAKYNAALALVKDLVAQGVPIHGVGFQGHQIVGSVPDFQAPLAAFAALGVEVAITELDVRMTLPETDALRAQQKTDYQNIIADCQAVSACVGVTVWDFTDKYSWIPSVQPGQGAALPWDNNLVKKPAYDGILAGF